MNNEKGKGRASDLHDSDKSHTGNSTPRSSSSMLERVTASATCLAQSAFATPTSNELSDAASAALTSTGKGRQPNGSSDSWAESSRTNQQSGPRTPQEQSRSSIRTGHKEEHIRDAESEFSSFLDGMDPFVPSSEPYIKADPFEAFKGRPLDISLEHVNARTDTQRDQAEHFKYDAIDEQQRNDGDAVLSLLSRPSATPDELDVLPKEEEVFNWALTDQQISRLRVIMDELFPAPEQHIPISLEHPLNLIPHMVSTSSISDTVAFQDMSYTYFGDTPRNRARQLWMEHWEGVLTRYTDEVWGNLHPLVEEAREEVKAIKESPRSTTIERSKALRRLRLVFDHVRKL